MVFSECNMGKFNYIISSRKNAVARIILNRPNVHNALNIEMIRELKESFDSVISDKSVRVVIFKAEGENFSAGADLNWMKSGMQQSSEELYSESLELAELFNAIYNTDKIVIAEVKGRAIGGANGIIAASDIVFAGKDSIFIFSEVRLGLIPATIAPYIIMRAGKTAAKEWMLSGRNITAEEAQKRNLIDHIVEENESFNNTIDNYIDHLLKNGPEAQDGIKKLIRTIDIKELDQLVKSSAEMLAHYRISPEAQDGISAFFEKRNPYWQAEDE